MLNIGYKWNVASNPKLEMAAINELEIDDQFQSNRYKSQSSWRCSNFHFVVFFLFLFRHFPRNPVDSRCIHGYIELNNCRFTYTIYLLHRHTYTNTHTDRHKYTNTNALSIESIRSIETHANWRTETHVKRLRFRGALPDALEQRCCASWRCMIVCSSAIDINNHENASHFPSTNAYAHTRARGYPTRKSIAAIVIC